MSRAWEDIEQRRHYLSRNAENTTRLAVAFTRFSTTGWGETSFEDCAEFGLVFIEMPFVTHSMSLTEDSPDLVDTRFPRGSGGVYKWKRNTHGFYTGAYCFVTVATQDPFITVSTEGVNDPGYELEHHFTFHGLAMKYIPDYQAER